MKTCQTSILFLVIITSQLVNAATNGIAPELLRYNLKTTVEAYDKVGRKDSKWDAEAKACLKAFAEIRSVTNGTPTELVEKLKTNLPPVIARGCDDPMIRYLHARFVLAMTKSAAELLPVFTEVASGLENSGYPAIRKFYGRLWVYRSTAEAGTDRNAIVLLEKAAPHLAEALADKTMPQREASAACDELLWPPSWSNLVRWNCYQIIEPALTKNWENSSFAQLARGRAYLTYAWKARGTGYANTVSDEGWKLLSERLDIAANSLEKAWSLDPRNADICMEMMRVELGQGKGRERLDTWFLRGLKLNPASYNIWYAKLEYLRPRWYGSIPQMIEYGWECMTNADWSGDLRLGLANAHYEVSREMSGREAMYGYLAKTNVWSDIHSNFEYFFKLYPKEVGYRHNYARFAAYAGDWDEFLRQAKMFPSTNFAYFGGVEQFNSYLANARQQLKENKGQK
jgi:hypothetical protein